MIQPALLLIDIQKGLDQWEYYGGKRNNPEAERNASQLLELWRERGGPGIHVKHNSTSVNSPLRRGQPGNQIKDLVQPLPIEPIFEKEVNSAFIGTGLDGYLRKRKITSIVVLCLFF